MKRKASTSFGLFSGFVGITLIVTGCNPPSGTRSGTAGGRKVSSNTTLPEKRETAVASAPMTAEPKGADAKPAGKSGDAGPQAEIPLKVASWEQAQEMIAGQKGKIVVLDLWSTFCPPCLKELPELAKIHQKHGGDVVCVSFNCNFAGIGSPEAEREEILKALKECGATFQNLISSDADEKLYMKVGIASIPVVQVYGRDGKLSKQFDNEKDEYGKEGFTYADHITPYVDKLAKETAK